MADEDHGHSTLLGDPHEAAGHLADLAHRPGRPGESCRVQHLHGVDDAYVRALSLDRGHHHVEIRLGHDRHRQGALPEALGAQANLRA